MSEERTPDELITSKCLTLARSLLKLEETELAATLVARAFQDTDPVVQARNTYDWLSRQKQYSQEQAWKLSGMDSLVAG